ncbi:TRAP transporter small permease [Acuticoccus kandeliae]|uniref:TRAP transporter small permease n=1 Tax=Acuticoccus kandeliae TaxID=2073160 RepID=UPI000D3E8B72|nr:TRAP transporter small permease [Acuticoccus kandeliae]
MPVLRIVNRVIDVVLVLALATIAAVLVTQVALRYLWHAPLPWPEELSQFLLVGISFLGMYRAFGENMHIKIEWLPKRPIVYRLLRAAGLVLVAIFLAYIGYGGFWLALGAWSQPSTALRLPMTIPYLIIPIACALSLVGLAMVLRNILTGRDATGESGS